MRIRPITIPTPPSSGVLLALLTFLLGLGQPVPPFAAAQDATGFLGVGFAQAPDGKYALINRVDYQSPADRAGVKRHDIVIAMDGLELQSAREFFDRIQKLAVGQEMVLRVRRAAEELDLAVTIAARDLPTLTRHTLDLAVEWLLKQQRPDGAWPRYFDIPAQVEPQPDAPSTALVIAGVLAAGEPYRRTHADSIEKAIQYLASRTSPAGAVSEPKEIMKYQNYATALTLQALVLHDRQRHADAIEKHARFLRSRQGIELPEFDPRYGAWDYYDENDEATFRGDTSVTSYVLSGLSMAGVPADDPVWKHALAFLHKTQNFAEQGEEKSDYDDGGFSFNPRNSKAGEVFIGALEMRFRSYGSTTADGLRSLLAAHLPRTDARAKAAFEWLSSHFTVKENPGFSPEIPVRFNQGIFYYYLHSLSRALDLFGDPILIGSDNRQVRWADEIAYKLVTKQEEDGSFRNEVNIMNENDPVLATALSVHALSVVRPYVEGKK